MFGDGVEWAARSRQKMGRDCEEKDIEGIIGKGGENEPTQDEKPDNSLFVGPVPLWEVAD